MMRHLILLLSVLVLSLPACTKKESSESVTTAGHNHEDHKEIWTCPMHPQIRKDAPGKCPICGMDLVKAESLSASDMSTAHEPEGHATFALSANRIQMIGVKYGTVERKPLFKSVEAAGRVAFDPELYTAQNEFVEAVRQLERVKDTPIADVKHSARRMMESAKLRLKILGLSDAQIAKLRTSGARDTGANLLITTLGENVWIYAEVFEMDLPSVAPGQKVRISGGSLEGKELFGKVASVDRVINSSTRTAKVRVLVPNAKTLLRPEAFVDTTILSPLGEQTVVPFDAVLDSGKEAWVFVVKDDGHFEPRTVVVGAHAGDEVAIKSGLRPGEKIVTSANFLVDSESRLKGVLSSQAGSATDEKPKAPSCPPGEEWHEQMKHCMKKVGG